MLRRNTKHLRVYPETDLNLRILKSEYEKEIGRPTKVQDLLDDMSKSKNIRELVLNHARFRRFK